MIVDNFLTSYGVLHDHARAEADYSGVRNPADGIVYPDVTVDIPQQCLDEIQVRLDEVMGWTVKINTIFMRLTSRQTSGAPHQAHTDSIMGDFTLLLYLNDGPGGTSFVRHIETGMDSDPTTFEESEAWLRDTNVPDAWEITEMVTMKANRANIIPATLMHRKEPPGEGFGDGPSNGRIVLTAFFE